MNLLVDGIQTKNVITTCYKKRLTIDGHTKDYTVYDIKLDALFYNDQNDRIATWVSKYKIENSITEFNLENREAYNNIIHGFIVDSNENAIKKTQKNIELIGQQEYGVVLSNGRIIDGNRRYTCLRNIQKSSSTTQYFKAVILDYDIEANKKQIKMLELQLQHGVDEKVSYSPIERIVGIYHDIVETQLLTVEEYCHSVDRGLKEIKEDIAIAKLLVEFLEFFNLNKQFHFVREFNLVDPLKELSKMLEKITNDDLREDLKLNVFTQLYAIKAGDKTRYIRKIRKIANDSRLLEEYLQSLNETIEEVIEETSKVDSTAPEIISKIQSNDRFAEIFTDSTEKYSTKADSKTTRNLPLKQLDKACDMLELINADIFKKLTQTQKEEITEKIEQIEEMILEFRSELNV